MSAQSVRGLDYVPLDDVRPADRNAKSHAHAVLSSSFARFGFVEPMMLDDRTGRIVAGHGRLDELRQARARDPQHPPAGVVLDAQRGWLVPVVTGWASRDDDEAQAYGLASNRATELGGWDPAVLLDTLTDLAERDALDGTGYTGDDALAMLSAQLGSLNADEDADTRKQLDGFTYRIVVDCDDEQHQADVLAQLDSLGLSVRAVVN